MSNLSKEIYTNEGALLTNLFDAFEINEDNALDKTEFYNLVSFVFIVHEYNLHENEVESEEQLIVSMNSYHDKEAKEKSEELAVFFPNKPSISLDDFLNTLLINPIPYDWEKLTFFKELCIECYSKPDNFNYVANKYNQRFNTTIPKLRTITLPSIPSIPLELYNNKEQIKKMMEYNEPDNEVVYKCNQASGSLRPENVDTTKVFFRLRKIGLPLDYLPLGMMQTLIESPNQYFIIETTNDKLDTVVSNNVLFHSQEWIGASHCQEGQGGKICIIKILNPEFQQGGRKKRNTRKSRKTRKTRKTRKSKK